MTKYSPRFGGGVTVDSNGKIVGGVWPPLSLKKKAKKSAKSSKSSKSAKSAKSKPVKKSVKKSVKKTVKKPVKKSVKKAKSKKSAKSKRPNVKQVKPGTTMWKICKKYT